MATRSKRFRPFFSFLCFFLGVALLLLSVGPAVTLWRTAQNAYGLQDILRSDYQQTRAFRSQLTHRLEQLLAMGAGGPVNRWAYSWDGGWYEDDGWGYDEWGWADEWGCWSDSLVEELNEAALLEGSDPVLYLYDTPRAGFKAEAKAGENGAGEDAEAADPEKELEQRRKVQQQEWQRQAQAFHELIAPDLNLLYAVSRDGKLLYTNAAGQNLDGAAGKLPEGYNFLLYFDGEKAAAVKDGAPLDLYGDGYYEEGDWYLPGYKNFPAGADLAGVQVTVACAASPRLYLSGQYGTSGSAASTCAFYQIERRLHESRSGLALLAAQAGAGAVLLALGLIQRSGRRRSAAALARLTGRIPFEAKLLFTFALLGTTLWLFWQQGLMDGWEQEVAFAIAYGEYSPGLLVWGLEDIFSSTGWLCWLFWCGWLWVNDLRANPRVWRTSLLSTAGLRLPLQKRLVRRGWVMAAAAVGIACCACWPLGLCLTRSLTYNAFIGFAAVCSTLFLVLLTALVLFLRSQRQLARDTEALADQIASVRAGNLSLPLTLPEDSDLAAAAHDLAQIQQGMGTALEERLKSEQMKVELIANVSHDIKTPLTSIIGYIELLRREPELPAHLRDYVTILDQKSQRLKTLVQDVVEISKAAAGQLPVHPKPLDLGKLLRQTLADMDEAISAAPVTLRAELPEEPVGIQADGERLYRVFQNLIQNALRYSLAGSRVYISLTRTAGEVCASIKNTSAAELPAGVDFTQRFVRGDASRTDGGNGLGLSIARSFTEACGGRFAVQTDADLFIASVCFAPCAGLPEDAEAEQPEAEDAGPKESAGPGETAD